MTRTLLARAALAASLVAGAAGLGGCGLADRVVGTRPLPVEATGGAPLSVTTATAITARVLGEAAAASSVASPAGAKQRASVLTGSALATAEAAARLGERPARPSALSVPAPPDVLAMSTGRAWPRWILATTLDEATRTRSLHVLVSSRASEPFRLSATVPMSGGASVPALGEVAQGVVMVDATRPPLAARPADVLKAYAAALAFPKGAASPLVSTRDGLATDLRANAARQARALGRLATLTQSHAVAAGDAGTPVGFALSGGGAVVFAQLVRTDTVTLHQGAKELLLPADVARLVKRSKVTGSVRVRTLENVVLVIPATGPARLIGAEEQRLDASGS